MNSGTTMPIRIGMLQDMHFPAFTDLLRDSLILAFEEAQANKIIDRPFEIITRQPLGLPGGSIRAVLDAVKELENEGVLAIFGPVAAENAVAIRDYIENVARIPCVSICGSDQWLGEYCFALTPGSMPEEPVVIAAWLASKKIKTVAVVKEGAFIGDEYFSYFTQAAREQNIDIVCIETVSQIETDMSDPVRRMHATQPGAIVFLGTGYPMVGINPALERIGWNPVRITSCAYMSCAFFGEGLRAVKGWYGTDNYDEGNPVGQAMINRFEQRFGYRPDNPIPRIGYDVGNLLAHGIGYARPLSPEGVKTGLEHVRLLPSASGSPGTMMSFGRYMRSCYRGGSYLCVRQVIDGDTDLRKKLPSVLANRYPFASAG